MQARVHFYYVFVGFLSKIALLRADFIVSVRKKRNLFAYFRKKLYLCKQIKYILMKTPDLTNDTRGEIVIYQSEEGKVSIDVLFQDETVWLPIEQMSILFGKSRSTINEHILNIYKEGELSEADTMRKIGISDFSTKPTNFYNLDVVISVGYRVHSMQGTRFRQWATQRIHEYIIKGYTLDDERLKGNGGRYFRELLQRIRDIRSSERNLYQQVTDISTLQANDTLIIVNADAKMTIIDFNTAPLADQLRLRTRIDPALLNILHKARHTVQTMALNAIRTRLRVDLGADLSLFLAQSGIDQSLLDRLFHFGKRYVPTHSLLLSVPRAIRSHRNRSRSLRSQWRHTHSRCNASHH